jgi:ferredoxin
MSTTGEAPLEENVPGPYYVDRSCIDCGLCPALAPHTFAESSDARYSYAHAQPKTAAEIAECEEALATCPTHSIHNDGAASQDLNRP